MKHLPDEDIQRISTVVVAETCHRLDRWNDRDEIRSDVLLGIAKALHDHDSDTVPVVAYAYYRARNEALDGIRRRSPVPRGDYQRGLRAVDLPPQMRPPVSSDALVTLTLADEHAAADFREVEDRLTRDELLHALPARTRDIVTAYFWDARPMQDIGRDLGVTTSRISQIIKEALCALRVTAVAA